MAIVLSPTVLLFCNLFSAQQKRRTKKEQIYAQYSTKEPRQAVAIRNDRDTPWHVHTSHLLRWSLAQAPATRKMEHSLEHSRPQCQSRHAQKSSGSRLENETESLSLFKGGSRFAYKVDSFLRLDKKSSIIWNTARGVHNPSTSTYSSTLFTRYFCLQWTVKSQVLQHMSHNNGWKAEVTKILSRTVGKKRIYWSKGNISLLYFKHGRRCVWFSRRRRQWKWSSSQSGSSYCSQGR